MELEKMELEIQKPAREDCLIKTWGNKSVTEGNRLTAVMNDLKPLLYCVAAHYLFISPYTCLDMPFHNVSSRH